MGIFLGKAADGWVVVAGAQVVGTGLEVQVFAAVAEGVGVQGVGVFFVAEGVVVIALIDRAVEVGGGDYVAVGVEEVVFGLVRTRPADEVDAAQIIVGDGVVLDLCHHVATVEKVGRPEVVHPLGCPDSLGVVGISHTGTIHSQGDQLVEAVVGVGCAAGFILTMGRGGLCQGVAVGVIGICGGDCLVIFGLGLRQQPVVGIVGVNGGVGFRACDCHLAPVACSIIGVVDRQAVGLAFLGQSPQTVIDIAGDLAGMVGFGLLTAGGIVSIAERGQGFAALFVFQPGDPVGQVVSVGFNGPVGTGQTDPVAVGVVDSCR